MSAGTVIIGASHAGVTCAAALREAGYTDRILLVSEEEGIPCHRPPLSKGYMTGAVSADSLPLKSASFYQEDNIDLLTGVKVTAVNPGQKNVVLSNGKIVSYDYLVLATGSKPRPWHGADLPEHVYTLRTVQDAASIARRAASLSGAVVVIGGGYVGLELAATLRTYFKKEVHVVEMAPRLLRRAASAELSEYVAELHKKAGNFLHLSCPVKAINAGHKTIIDVVLHDDAVINAEMVILGTGIVPEQTLAGEAGLACQDGIVVDKFCKTSDEFIFAIGDCSRFPVAHHAQTLRLECVQNAMDQARVAASVIVGEAKEYAAVPWFWSDQLGVKFQTAGIIEDGMTCVVRGEKSSGKYALFHFYSNGRLGAVETINQPALHMLARRLLAAEISPDMQQAGDVQFDLKGLIGK